MPTIKQLEALRWIVALGSFEKAAERLHTTQSAISKRIQELEAELRTPVFDRAQRSSRLTAKGEAIMTLAEELLSVRDRILAVGTSRAIAMRQLRFGVTELTAMTWLPAFVSELRASYPNIALEPEVEMSADLVESLRKGSLDFIIVPDTFWTPGLRRVPLINVQNAWMCSPELFHDRRMLPLRELARFNILTQGRRSGSGLVFGKWLEENGVEFPRLLTSNSLMAMVGLTLAAVGVSYLPQSCFGGLVEQGRLWVISTDPPLPAVTYALMFRGTESSNVVDSLANIARATCNFSDPIRWA
ncbi:LysR family transcriptional regulator [Roseomonas gilardii]|uniref:LysR family transcriptional regulator n=1 Tax=Roseomonas gilardii TaxID=257708 RepID=A0ABU3MLR7_9PROT|nr:LysR family transcriptional regulator [Roseomonas gilardii]MDT8333265.1 LysR family transcriptional regulator [Roseomonas gilardii]PZR08299.1 MAG: LysR family transcriptional regulator [Azospirillum brasilense]